MHTPRAATKGNVHTERESNGVYTAGCNNARDASPLHFVTHTWQSLAELVRLFVVRNHEGLVTKACWGWHSC